MTMGRNLRTAVLMTVVTTVVLGVIYPLVVTAIAQALFPDKANGQLIERNGTVIGSRLIGQAFSSPGYFRPRPSATSTPVRRREFRRQSARSDEQEADRYRQGQRGGSAQGESRRAHTHRVGHDVGIRIRPASLTRGRGFPDPPHCAGAGLVDSGGGAARQHAHRRPPAWISRGTACQRAGVESRARSGAPFEKVDGPWATGDGRWAIPIGNRKSEIGREERTENRRKDKGKEIRVNPRPVDRGNTASRESAATVCGRRGATTDRPRRDQ